MPSIKNAVAPPVFSSRVAKVVLPVSNLFRVKISLLAGP